MALFKGEIALQNQCGRHGVHHLLPLFGVFAAVQQNLVGVNGGAALVPKGDGQGGGFFQQGLHGLSLFRPGAPGAVHVDGVAQHQLLHAVLLRQGGDPFRHHFGAVGVDDGGEAGQEAGGVGDGDAGVGVAVVDGHDAHRGVLSFPVFSKVEYHRSRPGARAAEAAKILEIFLKKWLTAGLTYGTISLTCEKGLLLSCAFFAFQRRRRGPFPMAGRQSASAAEP